MIRDLELCFSSIFINKYGINLHLAEQVSACRLLAIKGSNILYIAYYR
jgi:hypothetical protein